MNLQELKKSFDIVVSLGASCLPTYHLKRRNLRTFSGPFDWVLSPSLSDVNRLLKNRMQGLMELDNMTLIQGSQYNLLNDNSEEQGGHSTYEIKDTIYNITSVHDFPVVPDGNWSINYPEYKEKLNKRINRFLEKIKNSNSILFVRTIASYEETVTLKSVLSELTDKNFNILIVNLEMGLENVMEQNWDIDGVCSLKSPHHQVVWYGDETAWDYILDGIKVNES